ncbi:MAG: hypothetical protein ACE5KG_01700, partial [Nitrososphaerales archaeon]
ANWKTQFMLDVKDTTGTVTGGGWHDENAIVTLVANQNVEREEVGGRRIKSLFQSWSGSASGEELRITISVDAPKQISANWEEEFYLKINSEIGRTSGEGWYKSGETAVFSARSTPGVLIREVVETWTGDIQTQSASGTIIMDGPKVITATWRTDYTPLFLVVGLIIAAGVVPAFLLRGRKKIPAETVSPKKSRKSKAKKK